MGFVRRSIRRSSRSRQPTTSSAPFLVFIVLGTAVLFIVLAVLVLVLLIALLPFLATFGFFSSNGLPPYWSGVLAGIPQLLYLGLIVWTCSFINYKVRVLPKRRQEALEFEEYSDQTSQATAELNEVSAFIETALQKAASTGNLEIVYQTSKLQLAELRSLHRNGPRQAQGISNGAFDLTNNELIFYGDGRTRKWKWANASAIYPQDDAIFITVSNRQTDSGFTGSDASVTALSELCAIVAARDKVAAAKESLNRIAQMKQSLLDDLASDQDSDAKQPIYLRFNTFVWSHWQRGTQARLKFAAIALASFTVFSLAISGLIQGTIGFGLIDESSQSDLSTQASSAKPNPAPTSATPDSTPEVSAPPAEPEDPLADLYTDTGALNLNNISLEGTYTGTIEVTENSSNTIDGVAVDAEDFYQPSDRVITIAPECNSQLITGEGCVIPHATYSLWVLGDNWNITDAEATGKTKDEQMPWSVDLDESQGGAFVLTALTHTRDQCLVDGRVAGETESEIGASLEFSDPVRVGEKFHFQNVALNYYDNASEAITGEGCYGSRWVVEGKFSNKKD